MNTDKIPVIAVVGPTASGKTSLGVELAKEFNGEVVSADSMQIYRGMDIVTAKPTREEMQGITHHLINFLSPDEKYSVADYVKDAGKCINDIYSIGKIPVIVGGTGLYIDSLFTNTDFGDVPDNTAVREELKRELDEKGGEYLLEQLRLIDPETAQRLHINNMGRIMRGIEIYRLTGETMSERIKNSRLKPSPYSPLFIGINYNSRDILYDRINLRVDIMLKQGLLQEAEKYINLSEDTTAKQAIGYKELKPYFMGNMSLEEAVESLKRETRRYAKRQLTWFRRNEYINWVYPDIDSEYISNAKNKVKEFLK